MAAPALVRAEQAGSATPPAAGDLDALDLADRTPQAGGAPAARARSWTAFIEGAAIATRRRADGRHAPAQRLSLDLGLDRSFGDGWRLVFANRIDLTRQAGIGGRDAFASVDTLKDLWLSRQLTPGLVVDAGRIRTRYGAAYAWNPTDFLRGGTVRSVVSADPASLRENRMGTGMLRGQALWAGGSATALVAPRLGSGPRSGDFDPDLGATNPNTRWLLAASQRLSAALSPQWLLTGGGGRPVRAGLNLSLLAGDATVAYLEWAGGRGRNHLDEALGRRGGTAFRQQLAIGASHTTAANVTLTAEWHHDGAAAGDAAWQRLQADPAAYGRYRQWVGREQMLTTRSGLFASIRAVDAPVRHVDLALSMRHDLVDASRWWLLQATWHLPQVDLGLQWQRTTGRTLSTWGAAANDRTLMVTGRWFL